MRHRSRNLQRLQKQGGYVELAKLLYQRMDENRQLKAGHVRLLREASQPVKDLVARVITIPAVGRISACTMVAFLQDGRRIPNKRKLWKYTGISIRRHESQGSGFQGASYSGNRTLKHVAMSAAITVVARGEDNALLRLWQRDIRKNVDPKRARRNMARKIVVIAQCLLRSGQEYRDERVES
jgi:transposase